MALGEIEILLQMIDQAYDRKSWHGTNLRGSIRGVSAEEAAWRPAPERHDIHELVVHAAYWKYVVLRRLTGLRRGSFPLQGSDWFVRPSEAGDEEWKADVALLDEMHQSLRDAIAAFDPRHLAKKYGKTTSIDLITGVAAHDLYHAGQIQLVKRLQREA
jgi:uncharacterized damage-inducible protein DinB